MPKKVKMYNLEKKYNFLLVLQEPEGLQQLSCRLIKLGIHPIFEILKGCTHISLSNTFFYPAVFEGNLQLHRRI